MALLQEIKVPLLAVNDTNLTVVEISFSDGQFVRKGQKIIVLETSKTTYELEVDTDGFIQYLCEIDKDYQVNETIAKLFSDESEISKRTSPPPTHANEHLNDMQSDSLISNWQGEPLFSQEALILIESLKISKSGFDNKDLVSKRDVEDLIGINKKETPLNDQPRSKELITNIPVNESQAIIHKLSSNKRREINFLSEVQSRNLVSTIQIAIDTTGILTPINSALSYLKGSLLPLIIYEASRLLSKYPLLNGYFTGDSIAVYKQVNVGFAIDIDKGLKVLKIENCDNKNLREIENEVFRLSAKYLDDQLDVEDLTDITFTITDLSSEGVLFFTPLINMRNSAILGISSIDEKLQRCILSISFDHSVTEGRSAARFLSELKNRIESYHANQDAIGLTEIRCYKCHKSLKEDLGDVGFVKCITPEGKENYICQTCFKGF